MKGLRLLSVLLVAALLATTIHMTLPTQTVYAATITVDSIGDTGGNDGKCTLREALLNANNDSQIGSTDCLAGNGDDIITFNLSYPATITLTGGDLRLIDNLTITGPGADQLTIDGNNASRIFDISTSLAVEISGLTIANGFASDGDDTSVSDGLNYGDKGGGIYNATDDLTLTDVTFNDNTASEMGGGIYNAVPLTNDTSPTFIDVTFDGNTANNDTNAVHTPSPGGGGMYNRVAGSPTLTNVTFRNNAAGNEGQGGGMFNSRSSPDLTDVTFSGNTAHKGDGGGMYNDTDSHPTLTNVTFSGNITYNGGGGGMYNLNGSTPTLNHVIFSGNAADNQGLGGGMGGGMYNQDCSPTLTNVTFSNNTAYYDGGGMHNALGMIRDTSPDLTNVTFSGNTAARYGGGMYNSLNNSPTLTNTTFSGNTAASAGGGMYNVGSNPVLTNVTFSSNTADNGGGMYNHTVDTFSSSPTLSNVTFSGNTADDGSGGGNGGGMYNASDCSPTLENVILWGNSAGTSGNEIFNFDNTTTPTITDSVVVGSNGSGGSWNTSLGMDGGGNLEADPALGALADNGGPTQTMALGPGSSAIDAGGANTTCAGTDQRGAVRPYGSGCDIGAYEVHESVTVGDCSSLLDGPQTFTFPTSGNTVTVDVDTGDGISCLTVEEMGPGASHPMATGPGTSDDALLTNNWWHITGNIVSGFGVDITLPYSSADADSRACRWPGGLGGYGWDCDDGTNTSFGAGTVTRTGVDSFSDWAVGDHVGPTTVTLTTFAIDGATWVPVGLLAIGVAGLMLFRKRRSLRGVQRLALHPCEADSDKKERTRCML